MRQRIRGWYARLHARGWGGPLLLSPGCASDGPAYPSDDLEIVVTCLDATVPGLSDDDPQDVVFTLQPIS